MSEIEYPIMPCQHEYKTIETIEGTERLIVTLFLKRKIRSYILRCDKCGRINQMDIIIPDQDLIKAEEAKK